MSTTVAAGSSSDHTILAGRTGVFTTTGEGLVRIKSGALGSGFETRRVTTAGETLIGPFDRDVVVTIVGVSGSTTGKGRRVVPAVVYEDDGVSSVGEQVPSGVQSVASGAGNLVRALFVGDSITAYAETTPAVTAVTALGGGLANVQQTSHSLSLGQKIRIAAAATPEVNVLSATVVTVTDPNNFVVSLDGPVHQVTGTVPVINQQDRASTRGWVNWFESFAGQPLARTWAAVPGATIATATDLLSKITAGTESIAFVCIGMNDIYSRGDALTTMQANFSLLMAAVKQRANRIAVLSVPPRNSADSAWSTGKQTVHTGFNRWLYDQCAANGWEFIDTWRATQNGVTYVNAGAANPDPTTGFAHDNTHPSMRGAAAIGAAVWAKVSKFFGVQGWKAAHPAAIGAAAGNLLTASDFASATAGVASNWSKDSATANMGATFTVAARAVATDGDACGKNQVMTLNYGTAAGTASVRFRRNAVHGLLAAGQRYYMAVQFSVTGALGLVGLELAMFGTVGSTFWLIFGHNQDSNALPITGDFSGVLYTPIATCPAGLTNLDVWVRPYLTAAQTTDVVIKCWQPQIVLVP